MLIVFYVGFFVFCFFKFVGFSSCSTFFCSFWLKRRQKIRRSQEASLPKLSKASYQLFTKFPEIKGIGLCSLGLAMFLGVCLFQVVGILP